MEDYIHEVNALVASGTTGPLNIKLEAKRLISPTMAYSHFQPGNIVAKGYDIIARFIHNPRLLTAWLNSQTPDTTPKRILADGTEEDDIIAGNSAVMRFKLPDIPDMFCYHFQTQVFPDMLKDDLLPALRQCTKPSGSYTVSGGTVTMSMDQVVQVLWIDSELLLPPNSLASTGDKQE